MLVLWRSMASIQYIPQTMPLPLPLLQAVHGAFVSLFLAQTQGTPYGSLVAALVAAVEPGARPAAGPDGSSVPKAASGQAAAPAGQALVPLNRKDVGQVPAAGCAAPAAEGRSRFGGFISRLRAPNRQ